MSKRKSSFFEKLTGAINVEEEDDLIENDVSMRSTGGRDNDKEWPQESETEAELTVDVFQTPDDIVLQTIVAGVDPLEIDVTITRDMITISGRRELSEEVSSGDYFHKELYWGAFSRTILLPEEVDVEEAQAVEKNGLLTIRLPKIDKKKKTKLQVRSN